MAFSFENVIKNFKINGKLISCERYGEGHINQTYLAIVDTNLKPINISCKKLTVRFLRTLISL